MRYFFYLIIFSLSLSAKAEEKTLLVLGDSISAGYGISLQQGWVYLLEQRLEELGYRYKVENASISGETSRGARARIAELLQRVKPDISIIELGGNDGLRGFSPDETMENLDHLVTQLSRCDSQVLLVPMRLPPNYGPVFNQRFEEIYRSLHEQHALTLSKFILDGVADNPELMQSDGIHPRASAQAVMLDNLWPSLLPLLEKH